MRILCTVLLLLALLAPGTAFADPGDSPAVSLWQSFFGWITDAVVDVFGSTDGPSAQGEGEAEPSLPNLGPTYSHGSATGVELPELGGAFGDPNGLNGDSAENEPTVPNMGGTTDPYG